jgi:hypothetical protein
VPKENQQRGGATDYWYRNFERGLQQQVGCSATRVLRKCVRESTVVDGSQGNRFLLLQRKQDGGGESKEQAKRNKARVVVIYFFPVSGNLNPAPVLLQ